MIGIIISINREVRREVPHLQASEAIRANGVLQCARESCVVVHVVCDLSEGARFDCFVLRLELFMFEN